MKRPLRGKRYDNLQQLSFAVNKWVYDTPTEFFIMGSTSWTSAGLDVSITRGEWMETLEEDED